MPECLSLDSQSLEFSPLVALHGRHLSLLDLLKGLCDLLFLQLRSVVSLLLQFELLGQVCEGPVLVKAGKPQLGFVPLEAV